ncbi:MAG: Holliday junction resolvase [Peptococcaceae bacterium]|nr:Holliday junction resolvase [Candidatus Syntrophopropionicum ammoniitolerans]
MWAKFIIPGDLPDLNEIIEAAKSHYMVYAAMKKVHTEKVAWVAKSAGRFKKVDVAIRWVCKDRRKDKDNIIAGTKFILDGLVVAGVLPNDGWRHIGNIRHSFGVDKHDPRVEVIIGSDDNG